MSVERVARILLAVTGLIAGYQATNAIIAHPALFGLTGEPWRLLLIGSLLLGMVGYLLGPWLVRGIQAGSRWISGTVQGIPTADLLAGAVGDRKSVV